MKIREETIIRVGKRSLHKNIGFLKSGYISNNSDNKKKIISKIVNVETPYLIVEFTGKEKSDIHGIEVRLISLDRQWVSEPVELNTKTLIKLRDEPITKRYMLYINIPAKVTFKIDALKLSPSEKYTLIEEEDFKNDVLVVTPMYPSSNKPYFATFVYSKVKKYLENGIEADVAVVSDNESKLYKYKFKGNSINKISFDDLRNVIQRGKYKKILVHFFDRQICNALMACDLDDKEVYIYCHGADVDLWNQNIFNGYFKCEYIFSQKENDLRYDRLNALKEFEKRKNVTWVFNTEWNYKNAQQATGLSFEKHEIIPCFIESKDFPYKERSKNSRCNILVLKKMDNVRQYAVDIAARIIMKLSKEEFFDKLSFTVAGAGNYQNELTNPLRKYENVKIVNGFYEHGKINSVFQEHGVLLAPSRYDTQGVTVGEAAMSGMVVVASKNTGVSDMIPEEIGTFFDNDNLDEAVEIIKDIYSNKKSINKLSKQFHDAISASASVAKVKKEVALLRRKNQVIDRLKEVGKESDDRKPALSIVIPAYNASQYLRNTIKSLVAHDKIHLLEIIVVNDGSKDDTVKVVKEIIDEASDPVKSAIVFIDKENGGHGSTINAGLEVAKGKYFRIVDADDRLDSESLAKHLDFLSKTDADIVFTNTMHDLSVESIFRPDHKYDFMRPHQIYDFDELCEPYYGFEGYGPVLSTTSTKTENLRRVGCKLTEKCFYVDIEYNYYMTEASRTAVLDPVDLYYYYLGRDGQSLSTESYKRNFYQHLKILESVICLLEQGKLTGPQYEHFVRVQLHETIFHQYKIALEMFNSYRKFRDVEKVLKKYPKYYDDPYLTPGYVRRMRKFKYPYYAVRKIAHNIRPKMSGLKRMVKSLHA